MTPRHQRAAVAALAVLVGLVGLVYWPGLSGPWLFDDFSNIRGNTFLRVTALDWQSLRSAAGSAAAGPLGRPIAYLSFALDHYLHGDASPYAYKLTNLVIHGLNALLVAALLCAVFGRLAARQVLPVRLAAPAALALTALWALHPIQISSVLYVVQRMTSLSATFGLAPRRWRRRSPRPTSNRKGAWSARTPDDDRRRTPLADTPWNPSGDVGRCWLSSVLRRSDDAGLGFLLHRLRGGTRRDRSVESGECAAGDRDEQAREQGSGESRTSLQGMAAWLRGQADEIVHANKFIDHFADRDIIRYSARSHRCVPS